VEDIVHGCSYFENDAEFYWKPVKLSEGRGDVRPTTKAENEPQSLNTATCGLPAVNVRTDFAHPLPHAFTRSTTSISKVTK